MNITEKNRLFTLAIIPDSGTESKSGNVNLHFLFGCFAVLVFLFLSCLFFIIGYHVKSYQERGYLKAVITMKKTMARIQYVENTIDTFSKRLKTIRRIDTAFRLFANLSVPDGSMYLAGVGGHDIIDPASFDGLGEDIKVTSKNVALALKSIDRQVAVLRTSLINVRSDIRLQIDLINNTPSILPTFSTNITSPFGMRRNPVNGMRHFHDAVDFSGKNGDKVFATADGEVITSSYHDIRGRFVEIHHKFGFETLYAHLDRIFVTVGQKVKKGDVIGTMGMTGRTTGINLHYGISLYGRKVNPSEYF